jgi:hypothetical protein
MKLVPPEMLNAIVSARVYVGEKAIKIAMTRTGASRREDREVTVTTGVSFFIFRVELE